MHLAGFEAPVLQQPMYDRDGLAGSADSHWKRSKVVGEFDGEEKYVKPEYLKGMTSSQAVVAEKNRENQCSGLQVLPWCGGTGPTSWSRAGWNAC